MKTKVILLALTMILSSCATTYRNKDGSSVTYGIPIVTEILTPYPYSYPYNYGYVHRSYHDAYICNPHFGTRHFPHY